MKKQLIIGSMVSYINQKYTDDRFEFVSVTGGYPGSNATKIRVRSEKYPDRPVYVMSYDAEGELLCRDTYLNVKFERETYAYLKDALVKGYGENIYLSYRPDDTGSYGKGSCSTTFEEFISAPGTYIYFLAAVACDIPDEEIALAKVKEIFADAVVKAHIYFIDTQESLADHAVKRIKETRYSKRLFMMKDTPDQYSKAEWRDGSCTRM